MLRRELLKLSSRPWFGALIALGTVAAGIAARFLLDPMLGSHSPFITFFPAIAVSVFLGRAPAGLLATFLSLLSGSFFFVFPRFTFGTAGTVDATLVAVFLLCAGIMILLGEAMHRARDKAEALRQEEKAAEERARHLLEMANEGIWILDQHARITMVNPRLCEMLGFTSDQMQGRLEWDFVFPEDVASARNLFERRRRGISEQVDFRFRSKDGQEIWTLMAARPRFDAAAKFSGALDMFTDISDRKRLEMELEKKVEVRTARLQEIVHELEVFSYSIAHDLRAPMRAMQGISKAVLEDYAHLLPPEGQDYLEKIAASASLLDRQVLNILEYNHLLGGELHLDEIDLLSVINGIIGSYPGLQDRRGCIHVPQELPPVLGNRGALAQVISNLLSNAVKFVPPGREPEVRISAVERDGMVRISFRDNGIGISKKGQQKIFRLFQRLQSQEAYEGTGIGLAIVKKAVERMGGQVGVNSETGQGSEFWIELQKAQVVLPEIAPLQTLSSPETARAQQAA